MPNIVEANGLVKQYPGSSQPAVRGISFAIQQGEIFGLLGPNGAGKTTTISMLSCLLSPTSGSATVAGFDLIRQPDAGQAADRAGAARPGPVSHDFCAR